MSAIGAVLLASVLATGSHALGVLFVQKRPEWTRRNAVSLSGFAGGLCVSAALLHLLPEASENLPILAPGGVLASFLALYLVETHLVRQAHHHGEEPGRDQDHAIHPSIGLMSALAFVIHTLFDGLAIGAGFRSTGASIPVASSAAVIVHEFPEGIATYSLLVAAGYGHRAAAIYAWAVTVVDPVVALVSFFFLGQHVSPRLIGFLLSLAAGSFLYIGATDLLPEVGRRARLRHTCMILLGALLMTALLFLH